VTGFEHYLPPDFSKLKNFGDEYDKEYQKANNYFRVAFGDSEDSKEILLKYLKETKLIESVPHIKKATYWKCTQLARIAWIVSEGGILNDQTRSWFDKNLSDLNLAYAKNEDVAEKSTDKPSVQDYAKEKLSNLIADLEEAERVSANHLAEAFQYRLREKTNDV